MKRLFVLIAIFSVWAFGFNYSGTWINKSAATYNDPVKLVINGKSVRPILKRDNKRVSLKAKNATNVGNGLFEVWGYGYKNLVLFIKPLNSYKLKVYAKKVDTENKRVATKIFTFVKQGSLNVDIRKRFIGNFKSMSPFSAIKKISIREVDGKLFVRAWKNTVNGVRPLGVTKAKLYNNKLHMTWNRGNLVVSATIRGYNYNSSNNRYENLELSVKATNLNTGLTNRQIMQLKRGRVAVPKHPIYKPHRIRPIYSY